MNKKIEVLKLITSEISQDSYEGMFSVGGKYPYRGQFLIRGSHMFAPAIQSVGYVTQIRVGRGQFKSDMYFLRLADGSLLTVENDCYLKMTHEQEPLCRTIFEMLPEDEGFESDPEYRDCEGIGERGFIVKNSMSVPTADAPFSILIQKETV